MNIGISYYTSRGKRDRNEDSVSILEGPRGLLAIVADGLGGHADGEIASRQAVATLNRELQSLKPDGAKLVEAIGCASRDVHDKCDPANPMHTTVAALWMEERAAVAAHVGDSRIYQFREGRIIYQSLDHSVAQMAVLVGEMEASEIRTSRDRNKLIRVLGDERIPKVDSKVLTVQPGDRFLLCSDGFWEAVTEEAMIAAMGASETAQQWLEAMRRIVEKKAKPTQDNHTAIALIWNNEM